MIRTAGILVLLACGGIPLQAQGWDVLRGLSPGDPIRVADAGGRQHKGRFSAVSDQKISVQTGQDLKEIDRGQVERVQVRSTSRRVRHILIGAAIGLAAGVAADQSIGRYFRNESGETTGARAVTYIAPIALFASIGAALPTYKTIYRAR